MGTGMDQWLIHNDSSSKYSKIGRCFLWTMAPTFSRTANFLGHPVALHGLIELMGWMFPNYLWNIVKLNYFKVSVALAADPKVSTHGKARLSADRPFHCPSLPYSHPGRENQLESHPPVQQVCIHLHLHRWYQGPLIHHKSFVGSAADSRRTSQPGIDVVVEWQLCRTICCLSTNHKIISGWHSIRTVSTWWHYSEFDMVGTISG